MTAERDATASAADAASASPTVKLKMAVRTDVVFGVPVNEMDEAIHAALLQLYFTQRGLTFDDFTPQALEVRRDILFEMDALLVAEGETATPLMRVKDGGNRNTAWQLLVDIAGAKLKLLGENEAGQIDWYT